MFYSENFVKRGIINRYLIVEYPRYSVKQGGAAFTVLLKNQLTEKKNQLTGLYILERQETLSFVRTEPLVLFTSVSPASRMGLIAALCF